MFHSNCRGYNSKKVSFLSIIKGVNPNLVTINEVGFKKNKKLNLPGYVSYNRNRQTEAMGGVATCVRNDEKVHALKTDEGEDKDEFIVTRHSQFYPAVNVVNIYGEIESRNSRSDIEARWNRIMEIVSRIKSRNEWVLIIADLNKAVGNKSNGVDGNHEKVSFGGKLVHKLLETEDYVLVNNTEKCKGGPFTRYDPSDPSNESKMSCLELVIVNKELFEHVEELVIDKDKVFTPHRPVGKGKLIFTDHFSLILKFSNLKMRKMMKGYQKRNVIWNIKCNEGWEKYEKMTEKNDELVELLDNEHLDSTQLATKIENVMNKIKFQAFGKVTIKESKIDDKGLDKLYMKRKHLIESKQEEKVKDVEEVITEKLLDLQRAAYEDKLKNLLDLKSNKGNQAAVFKLKANITGEKKTKQEAVCMADPISGELLFEPDEIRVASANYLTELLTNRAPSEGYERDIVVKEIIHETRMKENISEDEEFTDEDFGNLLKNLRKKNKDKYQFILRSGTDYLRILYSLFKKVWESESKPNQWEITIAHQLYKGKGKISEFRNQRFIHTKNENPKAFEHIVMSKAKPKIVAGCSKYQIGALPKHRSQEHLFTLKSTIGWYTSLDKPIILQLYDISKFFDREMLTDGMDSLYSAGVNGKVYRLIYELNKSTVLSISTGVA